MRALQLALATHLSLALKLSMALALALPPPPLLALSAGLPAGVVHVPAPGQAGSRPLGSPVAVPVPRKPEARA